MKKFSLLALAAAGLLLGACSSDKDDVNSTQQQASMDDAYIGISIQLPNQSSMTRANEDFADGETDEFTVIDATLYIFSGSSESDATYVAQYAIGTDYAPDGATNVTSTYSTNAIKIGNDVAANIKKYASDNTKHYYAYVIINNNSAITATPTTFSAFKDLPFATIGDNAIAAQKNIGPNGLLMTNAPVSSVAGGSSAPTGAQYTTLVEIDKNKVYSTAAEAKAHEAACIFVERAAVKITVTDNVATKTADGNAWTFEGWQIFNFAPTYYNTRHVEADWGSLFSAYVTTGTKSQYRFVSPTAFAPQVPSNHPGPYRTYFAKDLTYNEETPTLSRPQAVVDGSWIPSGNHGYTTENTFDVDHQTWQHTTQVAFRLRFNGGTGFYMVKGDDAIYTAVNAQTKVSTLITKVPEVQGLLREACEAISNRITGKPEITSSITVTMPATPARGNQAYTVTYSFDNSGTAVTLQDTDTKLVGGTPAKFSDLIDAAITTAKASFTVDYYAGGYAYYAARIKHFGDVETPWAADGEYITAPGTTISEIYGSNSTNRTKNFLGRYGVVRDNWYQLSLDGVSKIGSAEPINVTGSGKDTPDDEIENYLSVHVHIVPWVLRTQSVNF